MTQDFLGNDILPGEVVVYLNHHKTSSELKVGIVEKVTDKTVTINGSRRDGSKIISLNAVQEMGDYLIQKLRRDCT